MLGEHRENTRVSLEAALKVVFDRAALRERAVARAIDGQRARLSTSLLQHGR
jgi:hypothetical protein